MSDGGAGGVSTWPSGDEGGAGGALETAAAAHGTSSAAALAKAAFKAAAAAGASGPVAGAVVWNVFAAAILPPGPRILASNDSSPPGVAPLTSEKLLISRTSWKAASNPSRGRLPAFGYPAVSN